MDTLMKKWKKRSYYLAGRGYTGSLDLKSAKESFKSALELIDGDPVYATESIELKKFISDTTKKMVKEKKNEKKMWTKAFSGEEAALSPNKEAAAASSRTKKDEDDEEEEIDLSKFGLPKSLSAPQKSNSSPPSSDSSSSSAVAKKSSSSLLFGGVALFATLGMIFGLTYFRFKKR